jgi:hypothetical protein
MKEKRIYIDFNEMIDSNLFLFSKDDYKIDSEGNQIQLVAGMCVKVYMNDLNELGEEDNLIAEGIVELNTKEYEWTKAVKWNCRINEMGILHESEA